MLLVISLIYLINHADSRSQRPTHQKVIARSPRLPLESLERQVRWVKQPRFRLFPRIRADLSLFDRGPTLENRSKPYPVDSPSGQRARSVVLALARPRMGPDLWQAGQPSLEPDLHGQRLSRPGRRHRAGPDGRGPRSGLVAGPPGVAPGPERRHRDARVGRDRGRSSAPLAEPGQGGRAARGIRSRSSLPPARRPRARRRSGRRARLGAGTAGAGPGLPGGVAIACSTWCAAGLIPPSHRPIAAGPRSGPTRRAPTSSLRRRPRPGATAPPTCASRCSWRWGSGRCPRRRR